jgi:hypothetical protein
VEVAEEALQLQHLRLARHPNVIAWRWLCQARVPLAKLALQLMRQLAVVVVQDHQGAMVAQMRHAN